MDEQTRLIFDQADAALYPMTSGAAPAITLTQTSPETSHIASAVMKGRESAVRLAEAVDALRYYAAAETYAVVPERTPIATDRGEKARSLLGRFAD